MVAGKVKLSMGLQKSPSPSPKPNSSPKPPQIPSPSSAKQNPQNQKSGTGAVFSRSFGVYFPRSSAQVQPRPPDVAELLHLVEQLRERESLLRTQLLEQKLLQESAAILPILEKEINSKDSEIQKCGKKVQCLEAENERLRREVEILHSNLLEQKRDYELKIKAMENEVLELKNCLSDASSKSSNLSKNLRRCATVAPHSSHITSNESKKETTFESTAEQPRHSRSNSDEMVVLETSESVISIRSRIPRVPKPPPRPSGASLSLALSSRSCGSFSDSAERALLDLQPRIVLKSIPPPPPPPPPPTQLSTKVSPPPPPPPPPPKGMKAPAAKVRRVPEVVEFYHSLMRRDTRRDSGGSGAEATAAVNARDMIGEIENRSTHLLAIKTDVETQGDFIRFLIKEVESAAFTDIEDVVPFVKWLDDELSYLVDERAVLKHFEWPEQKADALREAAFGYCDLKKLESEASSFRDDPRQPCSRALKKMQALFEKLEHGVYNLSRMRESATKRYKVLQIPMDWMLDTGYVSQIKLASVKLAMKYMKSVSAELEMVGGCPEEEELIVQGVRFAFRVHQFASGFDVETMRAFQELRDKARWCHTQCQNQNQQKLVCRSAAC